MSDDRFKQARRSLMNQQRQQGSPQQQQQPQGGSSEDATALVDINALRAGPPNGPPPSPQGPGGPPRNPPMPAPSYDEDEHEATQMVDINAFQAAGAPGPSFGAQPAAPYGGGGGAPSQPPSFGAQPAQGGFDDGGFEEESTQFVNLDALQGGPPPAAGGGMGGPPPMGGAPMGGAPMGGAPMSPGPGPAPGMGGGEGSTQFVDLNQLAAGNSVGAMPDIPEPGKATPQQDPLLQQSYQYGPESIQQFGETTLIFARNLQGQDVVLKRVWEGHPDQMPEQLRGKLSEISVVKHPKLAGMSGMFASHSGCWVELERPSGMRLTHILGQGPQSPPMITEWASQVHQALKAIHDQGKVYNNLTPDAIWIDSQTGEAKLEPFGVLAFEDRGSLGAFGAPEVHQKQPPVPASDYFSFAVVIVTALTGVPDPGQVTRIEDKKQNKVLLQALDLQPKKRAKPTAILRALGFKGALDDDDKFDRRVMFPTIGVAVLLLVVVIIAAAMPEDKPPVPPQVNIPEVPADLEPSANAPGEISTDDRVKVISSFIYAPPEKKKGPPKEVLSEEQVDEIIAGINKTLDGSKKFKMEDKDYSQVLQGFTRIVRANNGKLDAKALELQQRLFDDKGVQKWRTEQLNRVEERLIKEKKFNEALLPYRKLALIDPNSNALPFFETNDGASVISIKRKGSSESAPDTESEE